MVLDALPQLSAVVPYLGYPALLAFIAYGIYNPEKIQVWSAIALGAFAFASRRAERASVARDIQARIDDFRKSEEYETILPSGIRIKWEKGKTFADLVEGEVLVIMEDHRERGRNFATALVAYISKGFLSETRPFVPEKIMLATEMLLAEKVIMKERRDAFQSFEREQIKPILLADPEASEIRTTLQSFDDAGLFTRIFLYELANYGKTRQGETTPTQEDWDEISQLYDLLRRFVMKQSGANMEGEPATHGDNLSICLVLVARMMTLVNAGTQAHVDFAMSYARSGVSTFYIIGWSDVAGFAEEATDKLLEGGLFEEDYREYFKIRGGKEVRFISRLHMVKSLPPPQVDKDRLRIIPRTFREAVISKPARSTAIPTPPSPSPVRVQVKPMTGEAVLIAAIGLMPSTQSEVLLSQLGDILLKVDPTFSPKNYGAANLTDFVSKYPQILRLTDPLAGGHRKCMILRSNE